jgi:hypothetical protein
MYYAWQQTLSRQRSAFKNETGVFNFEEEEEKVPVENPKVKDSNKEKIK